MQQQEDEWDRVRAWWRQRVNVSAAAADACVQRNARGGWSRAAAARVCRICYDESVDTMLALRCGEHVCGCRGLSETVHAQCLLQWVQHSGKLVCEICHQRYRPAAYARDDDRRALQNELDRERDPVFAPVATVATVTVTVPSAAPSSSSAFPAAHGPHPHPAHDDKWAFRLFVVCALTSIVLHSVHRRRLRQRCRDIAAQPFLHPLYRRALQLADRSGFCDVMQDAVDAETL